MKKMISLIVFGCFVATISYAYNGQQWNRLSRREKLIHVHGIYDGLIYYESAIKKALKSAIATFISFPK